MRLSVFPVAVIGLVIAATAYNAAGKRILSPETQHNQDFVLEVPDVDELAQAPVSRPSLAARPVAPDVIAVPPVESAELLRVDEREPLSPMGRAPDPRDLPPKPTILHRPVTMAAGAFEARGHRVALAGIDITSADEKCGSGASEWPCGIHARTAFRTWLRGRGMSCVVRPVPINETVVTDCTLGNQNPAEWLVAQGWVRATPGGPYEALGEEAKKERRGLFGPAPSSTVPVPPSGG